MSTYAVFGMTRPRAVELARKKVKTWKKAENDPRMTINLSVSEWEMAVQAEADKIMSGTQCVQLSEKYDAPSFAFEYASLARATTQARGLHVKAYEKIGTNTKTGRTMFSWTLVSEADQYRYSRSARV